MLVFLNSLHGEFLYDDGYSVQNNADVDASKTPLASLFRNNMWGEPFDKQHASHEVRGGCGRREGTGISDLILLLLLKLLFLLL